ncbi:hypothetical protein [Sorangium sp. So ce1000]|uniref:hypothetical protein n=1 Tax=Sorangium sp. So ce1000 TaxID=3133325 RepID=UPI003F5E1F5B
MLAWLLLVVLTAFAAFAALGVALRGRPEGRAETLILWTAILYALVCAPVLALGYINQLYPALLAISSFVLSAGAFVVSARGRSLHAHALEIRDAALAIGRLPQEALRLALRERSFVTLGLACALLVIPITAWLTYLAPSESWDGFFYHEPSVGYAIQNHGFRLVNLPSHMVVQGINSYPHLCHAFALWFVIFTDKTFIEIGNTLAAPGLMLATYVIAKRYCRDPVPLFGWSSAVLLVPAMLTQTRTSMIDVQVTFFILAAVHYATRPVLRLRDAVAATLCMVLIAGSKSSALSILPPLVVVTYGRVLLGHGRTRLGPALGLTACGGAVIAGTAALTFLRNWVVYHNPMWPIAYTIPSLHVDWPGLVTLADITYDKPLSELIKVKYHHPTGGIGDIIARDYGYGVPWVVVPLAAASLLVAVITAARRRLTGDPDARTENALLVGALGVAFIMGSPSLNIARFNAHIVAIAMIGVAWLGGSLRRGKRFHEGAVMGTLLLTMIPMFWTDWFFGLDFKGIAALLRLPARERATMNAQSFQMPRTTAQARERDLGPGDLVVYTQEMAFPGVLWNHTMSNRVEYLEFRSAATFLAEVDRLHPRWVVVGGASPGRAALETRSAEWQFVGTALQQDKLVAFRRVRN